MRTAFLVILIAVASPSASFSKPFSINHIYFGEVPHPEMVCTGGICPGNQIPPGKIFYANYKFPVDVNFFGSAPISTPTYDFSDDGLFRIRLQIGCSQALMESCVRSIRSVLEEEHGFFFWKEVMISDERRIWRGENESGDEAIISSSRNTASSKAFVAIQKKDLIERLMRRANPRLN